MDNTTNLKLGDQVYVKIAGHQVPGTVHAINGIMVTVLMKSGKTVNRTLSEITSASIA